MPSKSGQMTRSEHRYDCLFPTVRSALECGAISLKMREIVKMMLCLFASIGWAMAFQKWAPQTVVWLPLGLVPSLLLAGAGVFFAVRLRIRQYRR